MIDEGAVAHGGPAWFRLGDVRDWQPGPDVDVLVTNADPAMGAGAPRPARPLGPPSCRPAPGSPCRCPATSTRPRTGCCARSRAPVRRRARRPGRRRSTTPAGYADAADRRRCRASTPGRRRTCTCCPTTGAEHPVLRWMEGTALRPVKAALDENAWRAFRAELGGELAAAYPAAHGHVAFPFRRIFVVARTAPESRRRSLMTDLTSFIAGLPKAELHVHHVGSASPRIVAELAARHEGAVAGAGRPGRARRLLRVPRLRALHRGLPQRGRPDPRRRGRPDAHLRGRPASWPASRSGTPS